MQPGVINLNPTAATLEGVRGRAIQLLVATLIDDDLRRLLETAGFSFEERANGWRMIHRLGGELRVPEQLPAPDDGRAAKAMSQLAEVGPVYFRRSAVVVQRVAPALVPVIYGGIDTADPVVVSLPLLLDRFAGLDPAAAPVVALAAALEARGLGAAKQRELRTLLDQARGLDAQPLPPPEAPVADEAERQAIQLALYYWLKDWSEAARTVVTRRADLIRLGLANRRRSRKVAAVEPQPPALATPTPADPPADARVA